MLWTILLKCLINAVVMTVFLFLPFDNEYGSGRFMW